MNKTFKSANLKSPGLVSTFIFLLILSGFFYFAAFNVFRNEGPISLLLIMLFLGSFGPLISFLHTKSTITINDDQLIKKSVVRTKVIRISDYKGLYITDSVVGQVPVVLAIDNVSAKNEKWYNFLSIRHINLTKDKIFNPWDFRNIKKVVSLPYYEELYNILNEKITPHNNV